MKKKILCSVLFASFLSLSAVAQSAKVPDYGQTETIRLWDNSSAPHSNGLSGGETLNPPKGVGNVTEADMYIYAADKSCATGQAVVICPGGGYSMVALSHEGLQIAEMLSARGITAGVLKYRMPNTHREVPLEDAEEALRLLRERSGEYGFSVDSVGIVGSSAGGHLAASASNLLSESAAPNFTILLYPVISSEPQHTHMGSFKQLLGEGAPESLRVQYSMDKRVTANTPPAFIVLSDDDTTVPPMSSILYYTALKANGVKASMHIYPSGRHGWGMSDSFAYAEEWRSALFDWLKTL